MAQRDWQASYSLLAHVVLSWQRPGSPVAHLAMVGLVAAASVMTVAMDALEAGHQYPAFLLAVIISTFLGGVLVGLAAVALSTLATWILDFIIPVSFSTAETGHVQAVMGHVYGLMIPLISDDRIIAPSLVAILSAQTCSS